MNDVTDDPTDNNEPSPTPQLPPVSDALAGMDEAAVDKFARSLGWRPENEWGDAPRSVRPREYVTADAYVERTMTEIPMLRQRLRKQHERESERDREVASMREQLTAMNTTLAEATAVVKHLHRANETAADRGYQRARAELQAKLKNAAAGGDPDGAERAHEEIVALDKRQEESKAANGAAAPVVPAAAVTPEPAAVQPERNQDIVKWVSENSTWWNKNAGATAFATAEQHEIERANPNWTMAQTLAETTKRVKEKFPEAFGGYDPPEPENNPRRRAPATVRVPGGEAPSRHEAADLKYESLNAEEKSACETTIKMLGNGPDGKPLMTRDQWMKSYASYDDKGARQ